MQMRSRAGRTAITVTMVVLAVGGASALATELAKVNGQSISDKDMQMALGSLNEGQRSQLMKDANSRRQVLSSLIDQELLVGEAQKEKLDQDAEYKDALSAFRRNFLANRVLQKNLGAKMSESAAKKYYEANKRRYSTDQVHAQHILVSDEAKARELLAEARKPDTDFQSLAEKNSKDPSAKNNRGDLGFFDRSRMVPEFTEAAFAAKDGEVVGPVKTAYGYHIIKVLEKKTGKALNYDEVELRVKNDLRQELMTEYVSGLKKAAKIQINEAALQHP